MPGVPSGRACDGCRKLKKKCDEKVPSCSRCLRLGIECIGSGQRRYKFQPQQTFVVTGRKTNIPNKASPATQQPNEVQTILRPPPSNETTALTSRYVQATKITPNLQYNLAWTYGLFMLEIPQRMNENEALDTAVNALVCAHSNFCARSDVSVETLSSYSLALRSLRLCLSDPVKAVATETLCAIMLLLICQNLNGLEGQRWTGHCEGAAKILKARAGTKPRDTFEVQILLSLRSCVLFEGLLNDNIQLDPQDWISLVGNEMDQNHAEGKLMRYLSNVPKILRRARSAANASELANLRDELKPIHEASQKLSLELQTQWAASRSLAAETALRSVILRAYYQRAYGFGLMVAAILNWLLRAITPPFEAVDLVTESSYLVSQIVEHAQAAHVYRPLGAAYVLVVLGAAWLAAINDVEKAAVGNLLEDYRQDFPSRASDSFINEMKRIREEFQHIPIGSE